MKDDLIYLASPYTHPDVIVKHERYNKTRYVLSDMLNEGYIVFSPIVHCHHLHLEHEMPEDFDFWARYNIAVLRHCDRLMVLMLDGWKESKGVTYEIEAAKILGLPVEYMHGTDWILREPNG